MGYTIARGCDDSDGGHHVSDENTGATTAKSAADPARSRRTTRLIIWGAVAVVVLALLAGSMVYTEQSSFCPSCHEMRPYYAAWQNGGHTGHAQCVDCHVNAGVIAHIAHKPIALVEVWDHFFSDPRFPNYTVDIPNARCVGCHRTIPVKAGSTFSHAQHATRETCQACHATTGHLVTLEALQAEGVLKAAAATPPVPAGLAPSAVPGHIKVSCQQCHDQAKMKCSACHQAAHEPRGECSLCHTPGQKFAFVHGSPGSDCSQCHTPPVNHFNADCAGCHNPGIPFKDTKFTHPARVGNHSYLSFPCVKCHPTGYASSSCTCHGGQPPRGD